MNKKYRLLLVGIISCLALFGQEKLSLQEAIMLGLKNNYQVAISGIDERIAKRNNNWLEAGLLPTVSASLGQNNGWNDQNNPASFVNGKFSTQSINYGGDINWVLFGGFKVKLNKERLGLLEEQSSGNTTVVIENTVQAIVLGYYNTLLQQYKLDVLSQTLVSTNKNYALTKERQELGTKTTYDVLQGRTELLKDSTTYLLQELSYNNALRQLNLLMAVPVENKYILDEKFPKLPSDINLEIFKQQLKSNNISLKNQYVAIKLAETQKGLMKSNLFPSLTFNGGANKSVSSFKNDQFTRSGNESLNYFANFSLRFNLFDGRKKWRAFQNADLQREIAEVSLMEMEYKLTNELMSAYELLEARNQIQKIVNTSQDASKQTMQLASDRWKSGVISTLEYENAVNLYMNAEAQLIEATYQTVDAYINILRLSGLLMKQFSLSDEGK